MLWSLNYYLGIKLLNNTFFLRPSQFCQTSEIRDKDEYILRKKKQPKASWRIYSSAMLETKLRDWSCKIIHKPIANQSIWSSKYIQ